MREILLEQKKKLAYLLEAVQDQYMPADPEDPTKKTVQLLQDILGQLKALVYYATPSTGATADVEKEIGEFFVTEGKNNSQTVLKELVRKTLKEYMSEQNTIKGDKQ